MSQNKILAIKPFTKKLNPQPLITPPIGHYQSKSMVNRANKTSAPSWWTPVWRGLIADPDCKHRKAMGSALWLYLYLLAYANRQTGTVRRTQRAIAQDTGYPLRTIQFNLNKLRREGYLTVERPGKYLKIQIKKWKGFIKQKNNDS